MKYSERDELVASLRELASFIEEKGIALPCPNSIRYHRFVSVYDYEVSKDGGSDLNEAATKERLQKLAKALGSCDKDYNDYSFKLTKHFGKRVSVQFEANRDAVCEKKQVGTKMVDKYESKVVGQVEEPVYEIICRPLLADE